MNPSRTFKLGTRGSPLALWQAERAKTLLQQSAPAHRVEIVPIQTTGDKILDKPLVQVGGKGIFTKEIELALLQGEIDFAVHSYKDLPTVLPEGLGVVCIPERESPFDALFARKGTRLCDLPEQPILATGSLRRRAQILSVRPDARVVDVRGNVNTRLRKFRESEWDGLIMAHAAIERMGWGDQIAGVLSPDEMLPAPAQGALAIEARLDDAETLALLETIHNPEAAITSRAERAFLATLEGGCQVPIAAYAVVENGGIVLQGLIASLDGKTCIRRSVQAPADQAIEAGQQLAEGVLAAGGKKIIEELKAL